MMAQLTGSEKQIAWAETIRTAKTAELEAWRQNMLAMAAKTARTATMTDEVIAAKITEYEALIGKVLGNTSAAYWIDRRGFDARQLLKLAAQE
jgi:hypothetical protein